MSSRAQMKEEVRCERRLLRQLRGQRDNLIKQAETLIRGNTMKVDEIRSLTLRVEKLKGEGRWSRPEAVHPTGSEGEDQNEDQEEVNRRSTIGIFPEEIYLKIIKEISAPTDLWNLTNTCQLFDSLLITEKCLGNWKTGWMIEKAIPYLCFHLPREMLLKSRLVSKGWKKAVDEYLQDHPSLRPYQNDNGKKDPMRLDHVNPLKEKELYQRNCFTFSNELSDNSDVLNDPRMPRQEGESPFIGRYVGVKIGRASDYEPEDRPTDDWWNRLYQFMNSFGKEIWYFTLVLPVAFNRQVKSKLDEFISLELLYSMPNLRQLTIDFCGNGYKFLPRLPFPFLPHLESIQMLNFPQSLPNALLHCLIVFYRSQLRKVYIDGASWTLQGMRLGGITELCLELGKGDKAISDEIYAIRPTMVPNLTKLSLIFPDEPRECLYEELLLYLNRLTRDSATNLTCLRLSGNLQGLRFDSGKGLGKGYSFLPYFPEPSTLKTLEVQYEWDIYSEDNYMSFNFLLRCFPLIESLIIFVRAYTDKDLPDMGLDVDLLPNNACMNMKEACWNDDEDDFLELQKFMFQGEDMHRANVWKLLSQLKYITVQGEVFTREKYEMYAGN